jgi:hypothetical protein
MISPTIMPGEPFLRDHLGHPIPSPALLGPIGNRFRREVKDFAADHEIPILQLRKPDRSRWDDRKLDHVRPYLEQAEREQRFGVVAIVGCQEFQWVFSARNRSGLGKVVSFEYFREERRVGIYYFYILDPDFGPGFIKIGTTLRTRRRYGSTGTSGPNVKPLVLACSSRRCRTDLRPASSPSSCRRSATPSAPITSRRSLTAGCP